MIEDKNTSIYTGITNDMSKRFKAHEMGKGAKALRGKSPLKLVYQSEALDRITAAKIEYKIKQLSRNNKIKIIEQQKSILSLLVND